MSKKRRILLASVLLLVLVCGAFAWGWYARSLAPTASSEPFYVRYEKGTSWDGAVNDLVNKGVIRNAKAFKLYCYLNRQEQMVRVGTFELRGGMTTQQILRSLKHPVEQQVRIPEGWWIVRVAPILEKQNVCSAEEYIAATQSPEMFKDDVSFELPKESLEGYLYPDTYDLPPLMGATAVVRRQLKRFEEMVWKPAMEAGITAEQLHRAIVVGSMVELEAGVDEDRPRIAGVIENRLAINQRLQIDATVLYALQEWRVLKPGEVNKVDSPFNTYRNAGLPPGPIGSPAWRSISAALNPEKHPYFFYVARPDWTHYFSKTYDEHRANINKARAEFAAKESA